MHTQKDRQDQIQHSALSLFWNTEQISHTLHYSLLTALYVAISEHTDDHNNTTYPATSAAEPVSASSSTDVYKYSREVLLSNWQTITKARYQSWFKPQTFHKVIPGTSYFPGLFQDKGFFHDLHVTFSGQGLFPWPPCLGNNCQIFN